MSKKNSVIAADLRKKSDAELAKLLTETQLACEKDILVMALKKGKQTHLASQKRRLIARLQTVIAEKQFIQNNG